MAAFKINQADLSFVLQQIKIAEAHAAGIPLTSILLDANGQVVADPAATIGGVSYYVVDPDTSDWVPNPLLSSAVLAIPDPHVPYGLRTVDGTYNNIVPGRETWGAADQSMPRLLDPKYTTGSGEVDLNGPTNPGGEVVGGNYADPGNIVDTAPRTISNLIVDMSLNNPAAIIAALTFAGSEDVLADQAEISDAFEALKQARDTGDVANIPGLEAALDAVLEAKGVTVNNGSIDIPNVAPDEGLSAPFNAWMTFFGQFFDHGLDLISKGGDGVGTVFVPLADDDPLVTHGPDGIAGNGDEVPPQLRFMTLTRATPTEDGSQTNTTTPFVDQNQTYTSHASHQVFLREYRMTDDGPVSTGRLLTGADGGLATWADIKAQAAEMLGIELTDGDVLNIPLIQTDPYGEFIRGDNGLPQLVRLNPDGTLNSLIEGDLGAPVNTFTALAARIGHAFLDDIAHNANPLNSQTGALKIADDDTDLGLADSVSTAGRYDNELLDRHYITGDGRGNENIGLTAVHHIFHSEHNRQVDTQKLTILQSGNLAFVNEWLSVDIDAATLTAFNDGYDAAANKGAYLTGNALFNDGNWDGERLFQAARFATEMQYQHLVFEEFARKVQPNIDVFVFNSITDVDPSIFSEFANTVYRFGHSMLTENMPRIDADGNPMDAGLGLVEAFLNPVLFDQTLAGVSISHDEAAAAIVRGMTIERGNEIDEFVVDALRNNLLGLPLDLAAINIARGRDTGMPSLNDARGQLYAASGSSFLKPYDHWADFAANLKNPASIVNFIAAYGTHDTITAATTLEDKRDAAMALVFGGAGAPADRAQFLSGTGAWAGVETGLNLVDLWIGGLAEKKMPFGGFLGSTFNAVFELQLENLQDGDRFYYLTRTQGQNMLNALEQNSFAKMIMANTALADAGPDGIRGTADDIVLRHIGVDAFATYDYVLEVNVANQADYDPNDLSATGKDPTGNDPFLEAMGFGKVVRVDPTGQVTENYIRVFGGEHVVLGGTDGNDTIIADFGDDGIWGDAGDDRIEAGAGVDLVNGGAGNDIITDSGDSGDFLKGDEGDDVIANSNGLDILMGGTGKDVFFVGVDATEVFGGEGDDFILGGDDADFLLGNEGDDWIEGGGGFDTTAGDNSELFFNSAIKGHDVMFAGSDEHDFDAESGDDIMVQGESVIRNEGMFGFDWSIFKGVEFGANADLRVPIFTTEQADILRNRFDKVEALSGWDYDDILRGDDRVRDTDGAATIGTAEGVFFQDELTQAGVDRIDGLRALLGNLIDAPNGATAEERELEIAFDGGNVLLGGGGDDLLQGNGGDDFLDGDAWLNVRIRITGAGQANTGANEIATVDSLKHVFAAGEVDDPSWVGKSLFELMISRTIVPNQLHIVREILEDDGAGDTDIAVFNDVRANYTITSNEDGTITVTQNAVTVGGIDPLTGRNLVSDGVDTLRNIEMLRFADMDLMLTPPQLQLDAFNPGGTYADNFTAATYGNSNGTINWGPDWIETGDDNSATAAAGQIRITGGQLQFDTGDGASISRQVDLSAASSARLTYSVNENGFDPGETILVEFSPDGSAPFTLLETVNFTTGNASRAFDLTGPFTANAVIRFTASSVAGFNEFVNIDNLAFTLTVPNPSPTVDYQTTFTENGAAVAIASGPSIADDAGQMASARIVLTNASVGDQLLVGALPAGIAAAVNTAVAGQITVTLTGAASLGAYQNAIQAVSYRNVSNDPVAGDRIINVTVNDGVLDSNVATTTVNVVPVNDAPNAVIDNVVTNIEGPVFIAEWMMLQNDTDVDSSVLRVIGATENDANFGIVYDPATSGVTATRTDGDNTKDFTYTLSDGSLTDTADVDITWDTLGTISGTNGADILLGDAQSSTFDGNAGNDVIITGAGDDTIIWNANNAAANSNLNSDGRDIVDGGEGTDTFVINGNAANFVAEAYRIYSREAADAAGLVVTNPFAEIVITRGGTTSASIIAELDAVEEIIVNTDNGNDTVQVIGDFSPTSLAINTITINGGSGDDVVDITALSSAHRIVFRSNGGNDTIVGNIRPQDVVELAAGQDISTYSLVDNGNGTQSLTNGSHSITFTGAVPPQFGGDSTPDDDAIDGAFEYTASDLAGLKALVSGSQPAQNGDDDVPTGVRELSGYNNNEANPGWGAADQTFIRITNPHYDAPDEDGNRGINPIFDGLDPRTISNILGAQEAGLPHAGNDANIFFMAMGQYIDHGLDFLPKGGNGSIPIGGVGGGDPFSGNPADLTRATVVGYDEDGTPLHKNQTSPYVDQNQAYGSHNLVGQFLRESDGNQGYGMRLFSGAPDPSNPEFSLLPTLRELIQHHWYADTIFTDPGLPGGQMSFRAYYTNYAIDENTTGTLFDDEAGAFDPGVVSKVISNFMGSGHPLLLDTNPFIDVLDHYVAGDGRANENFALTSIHTIWARNHNYHVDGLVAAGFEGTAEEVFQAAKMINEAEYQRVVFDEYLDTLLGGLRSVGTHGFEEYDPNANAAISHEFAAAAFRFGHSLIGQKLTVLDAEGNPIEVNLFDAFLNPSNAPGVFTGPLPPGYVPQPGYAQHGVNAIIGGNISQPSEAVDFNIVDAVRNDLVRISADLFAFNVARGWDVGLGTLNQIRMDLAASTDPYVSQAVGFVGGNLSAYTSWGDFQARNGLSDAVIAQFMEAYPDLVLAAADIAAFQAINPDIAIAMQSDGTGIVKGIDRVDFWVGGLAEAHVNGGIVGETFWVVLSEQFERLQDADRFYYISRFDEFDFYENFIDGQEFADIVARNTGMDDLPEHMFRTDDLDDDNTDDDDDTVDDDDDDTVDDDDDTVDDDDDDTVDDDDDTVDDDDDDAPIPPVAGLVLMGTAGADAMMGSAEADVFSGGEGDDVMLGGDDDDTLMGGSGSDLLKGDGGRDMIFGGADDDVLMGGAGDDMIFGEAGDDRIFGDDGDDVLEGGAGSDTVYGGAGDDRFIARKGDGDDILWGEDGQDTLDYSVIMAKLTIDLGNGTMQHGHVVSAHSGFDAVFGFENVIGGWNDDVIIASSVANVMDGGGGNDTFVFRTAADADGDLITGFAHGDRIDLAGMAGPSGFTLATTSLTGAGQVLVTHVTGDDGEALTRIQGNVSGGAGADFTLDVAGHHDLTQSDFNGVA
ncbi:peroxidase family protein [Aurantimonas endophytica]|uniref:Ca2+-binding RTX toxin-like protein n=1 Tax=Aurantimonas endophytica TaxID=1522175 RepID=A0A7W6MQW5_9HYPH|nr:peroxidase family protein [Aurantimonas endophytica]MBB4004415.1 Ca2+-binding RTX toxin-like protein [Aurantimonas endophytica]MCO6405253.1 calcium-binding protein [Aurantimonas endophytica]